MQPLISLRLIVLAAVGLFGTASCGGPGEGAGGGTVWESDEGLLRFVPADTPYLFAKVGPLPEAVADKIEPQIEAALTGYARLLRSGVVESAAGNPELTDEERARIAAMVNAVADVLSVQGLEDAGWTRDSTLALYGAGLAPVLRATMSDAGKLEAAVTRFEEAAGSQLGVATVAGRPYRYAGDDTARVVLAVLDDSAVLSVVPADLSDERLATVLGLAAPAESLASSGKLAEIAAEYGFSPHYVGFIDVDAIAAIFLENQAGLDAELLGLVDYDVSSLSEVCRTEMREMANVVPRVVFGSTGLDPQRLSTNTVVELREDIAAGLTTVSAPVPGLGAMRSGLLSLGMGFDLPAARDFYAARLDAMAADPFQCELLGNTQAGVAAGRQALDTPVPPILYDFKGFVAVVDDVQGMDLANDVPPSEVDMRLLIAADNAVGLVSMGALFSPELAALNLQPDGQPVPLDLPQLPPQMGTAYVAMSQNAVGFSIGRNAEARLVEIMSAPAGEEGNLLSWDMDAQRYYEFMAEAMALSPASEEEIPPEVREAIAEMMSAVEGAVDRMSLDVKLTERGIEMPYTLTLAE